MEALDGVWVMVVLKGIEVSAVETELVAVMVVAAAVMRVVACGVNETVGTA